MWRSVKGGMTRINAATLCEGGVVGAAMEAMSREAGFWLLFRLFQVAFLRKLCAKVSRSVSTFSLSRSMKRREL